MQKNFSPLHMYVHRLSRRKPGMMTEEFSSINLYDTIHSPTSRKFPSGPPGSRNAGPEQSGRASTRVRPGQRKIPPLDKEKAILVPSALPFFRQDADAKSFDELRREAADKVKSAAKSFVEKGKMVQQRIRTLSANQDSLESIIDHPKHSSSVSTFKTRSPGMLTCSRCDRALDHQYKHFCSECKHVFCAACSLHKQDSTNTEGSCLGICTGCDGTLAGANKNGLQDALPRATKNTVGSEAGTEERNNPINITSQHKPASVSRPKLKPFSQAAESPSGSERGVERQHSSDEDCAPSRPQTPLATIEWNCTSSPVIDLNNTILGRIDGGGEDESKSLDSSGGNSFFNSPTRTELLIIGNDASSLIGQSTISPERIDFALDSVAALEKQKSMEDPDPPSHELNDNNIEVLNLSDEHLSLQQVIHGNPLSVPGDSIDESDMMHEEPVPQVSNNTTSTDPANIYLLHATSSGNINTDEIVFGSTLVVADSRSAPEAPAPIEVDIEKSADIVPTLEDSIDVCYFASSNCDIDVPQLQEDLPLSSVLTDPLVSKVKIEALALELIRPSDSPTMDIESKASTLSPSGQEDGADDSNASSNETDSVMISPRVYQERYELDPVVDPSLPSEGLQADEEASAKVSVSMHSLSPVSSHSVCESSVALTPESRRSPRGTSSDISSNIYFVSPAPGTHSLDYSASPLCKDWEHINGDVLNTDNISSDFGGLGSDINQENVDAEIIKVSTIEPEMSEDCNAIEMAAPGLNASKKDEAMITKEDNQKWMLAIAEVTKKIPISFMRAALLVIYVFFFSFIALRIGRLCFRSDVEPNTLALTQHISINWGAVREVQPTPLAIAAKDSVLDPDIRSEVHIEASKALWTPHFEQPHSAPGIRYVFKLAPTRPKDSASIPSEPESDLRFQTPASEGTVAIHRFQFWKFFNTLLSPLRSVLRAPQRFVSTSLLSLRRLFINAQ